ncbi:hypothetical protein HGRIS_002011 [Hohenbuehelia grisea]|uniref:Uncharacterized protein n=1 Tax=Hohenbuehelia grisea TaxID=104357 RepID=A0ABR3JJ61_9AGAR
MGLPIAVLGVRLSQLDHKVGHARLAYSVVYVRQQRPGWDYSQVCLTTCRSAQGCHSPGGSCYRNHKNLSFVWQLSSTVFYTSIQFSIARYKYRMGSSTLCSR